MSFNNTMQTYKVKADTKIGMKVTKDAKTIDLLIQSGNVVAGVKGSQRVPIVDSDVVAQDGGCSRNPSGTTTLSEGYLEVIDLKDEQDFCFKDLYDTLWAESIRQGQDPKTEISPELVNIIMERRATKIAGVNEILVVRGIKGSTASAMSNYNKVNGIVTQVKSGSYIDLSYTGATAGGYTGSTFVDQLTNAFLKMPVDISSKDDFYIFMGVDMHNKYKASIKKGKYFIEEDLNQLQNMGAKIWPTPGLNADSGYAGGEIFMGRLSDIRYGTDKETDANTADFEYLQTKIWAMDFHWALGVLVLFPDQFGYVLKADNVI